MAAFDHGKSSSKSEIKITSALCAVWCTVIGGFVLLSLKVKIPFDIINQPLVGIEILASVVVLGHLVFMAVSSATAGRGTFRLKPKSVIKCLCGVVVACIIFHVLAILFGAPALESSRETFHFAMLLTSLTVIPACCVLGADGGKWATVFALGRPALGNETVIYITSISSLIGAWLGAVPIPLDWDRPWQVWPASCVLGSLFGYFLGLLISAAYLPLRYRQMYKTKLT